MEYETRISTEQGNYIVASGIDFEEVLLKEPFILNGATITPGDTTTMFGWFDRPCRYVGALPSDGLFVQAVFYLGAGKPDLFSQAAEYYDLTFIIAEDRVGKSYKAGSFRDSFLRRSSAGKLVWK